MYLKCSATVDSEPKWKPLNGHCLCFHQTFKLREMWLQGMAIVWKVHSHFNIIQISKSVHMRFVADNWQWNGGVFFMVLLFFPPVSIIPPTHYPRFYLHLPEEPVCLGFCVFVWVCVCLCVGFVMCGCFGNVYTVF
jgi:hypothetical protein